MSVERTPPKELVDAALEQLPKLSMDNLEGLTNEKKLLAMAASDKKLMQFIEENEGTLLMRSKVTDREQLKQELKKLAEYLKVKQGVAESKQTFFGKLRALAWKPVEWAKNIVLYPIRHPFKALAIAAIALAAAGIAAGLGVAWVEAFLQSVGLAKVTAISKSLIAWTRGVQGVAPLMEQPAQLML